MSLKDRVHIARRFQRAIRIDADLSDPKALEGFVCPPSSADVLASMARHVSETGHGAFTWTGPYGSGKSSLIVALNALLSGNKKTRDNAAKAVGKQTAEALWKALPLKKQGWQALPVVGRRDDPVEVLGEALEEAGLADEPDGGFWSEDQVLEAVANISACNPKDCGGLIIFIDEMGKFLEAAANRDSDVYLFQQLAEAASRSGGRLVVVGVLHQAFEEYAHQLSRQMRDEWTKIQGRFVDLAVNAAGEEQIELLSRAIETDHNPAKPGKVAKQVTALIKQQKAGISTHFPMLLEGCWPLHPVVACLLGPISRRRFGQNQRSVFGFLNSAEPEGFQDFLAQASDGDLYRPAQLWDYLKLNLEPSILSSPDGHRWALAAEAIDRCEGMGGSRLCVDVLKTIAIVDLFKERSGLLPSVELLASCFPKASKQEIQAAISQLESWSMILLKRFQSAYAIYAGSDFDIDEAVASAKDELQGLDFKALKRLADLQPVLAKRHFHETGTLRWFDVDLAPVCLLTELAEAYEPKGGAIGQFLIAIPTLDESPEEVDDKCRQAARTADDWDIVVGISENSWRIPDLAKELLATEKVRNERSELAGDAVARREVRARLIELQTKLEAELHQIFNASHWHVKHRKPQRFSQVGLNILASELADKRFDKAPKLHNELLNRAKPSSNAVAAQNALLRKMVLEKDSPSLGIKGFPAEGGLYASLLQKTGLHQKTRVGWCFSSPEKWKKDPYRLKPMWLAAKEHLKENADRTVSLSELYGIWADAPYGVKEGLLPLLAVSFLLSNQDTLAVYREGIFQAQFTDLDVDYLTKEPGDIQVRWMDLGAVSRRLLSELADVARDIDRNKTLAHLEPIDVARALVAIYDGLPNWTKRTARLSANAIRIRDLFKRANDPNKFLFDDIPSLLDIESDLAREEDVQGLVGVIREGMQELVQAYPAMLNRLNENMLSELRVPNDSPQAIAELRERAINIRDLAGDFRLEALVGRLTRFDNTTEDVEGIAGLAANKPPQTWVDPDVDRATVELADLAQRFVRAEVFAHVKGRKDKRHSMAVIMGSGQQQALPLLGEFDVSDYDEDKIEALVAQVEAALEQSGPTERNLVLGALAKVIARHLEENAAPQPSSSSHNVSKEAH